jgi:hypothetical protein
MTVLASARCGGKRVLGRSLPFGTARPAGASRAPTSSSRVTTSAERLVVCCSDLRDAKPPDRSIAALCRRGRIRPVRTSRRSSRRRCGFRSAKEAERPGADIRPAGVLAAFHHLSTEREAQPAEHEARARPRQAADADRAEPPHRQLKNVDSSSESTFFTFRTSVTCTPSPRCASVWHRR